MAVMLLTLPTLLIWLAANFIKIDAEIVDKKKKKNFDTLYSEAYFHLIDSLTGYKRISFNFLP